MTLVDETMVHMTDTDINIKESRSEAAKKAQCCWENMSNKDKDRWCFLDGLSFSLLRGIMSYRFWLMHIITIMWMVIYWEPQDNRQYYFSMICIILLGSQMALGLLHIIVRKYKTRLFISTVKPYIKKEAKNG